MRTILVGIALLAAAAPARAQMIWGGIYERGLRPGAYVPYDGEPYTQRYSGPGPTNIYLNGNGWKLWYLDYLDRADRAYKFGYAPPAPPRYGPQPVDVDGVIIEPAPEAGEPAPVVIEETQPTRIRIGIGFGRFRSR